MGQNRQYLFNMSYFEVFGVLTGVGVDVSKFFGLGAGVLKSGAGVESQKCDSAHLWLLPVRGFFETETDQELLKIQYDHLAVEKSCHTATIDG